MSEKIQQDVCPDVKADEADDSYYIEGELDAIGHLTACNKCGRKILVEMALFGVPHHAGVTVICGECLELPEQFRKEQPKIVQKIENWLHGAQGSREDRSDNDQTQRGDAS